MSDNQEDVPRDFLQLVYTLGHGGGGGGRSGIKYENGNDDEEDRPYKRVLIANNTRMPRMLPAHTAADDPANITPIEGGGAVAGSTTLLTHMTAASSSRSRSPPPIPPVVPALPVLQHQLNNPPLGVVTGTTGGGGGGGSSRL